MQVWGHNRCENTSVYTLACGQLKASSLPHGGAPAEITPTSLWAVCSINFNAIQECFVGQWLTIFPIFVFSNVCTKVTFYA